MLLSAQESEYLIFENHMFTAAPDKVQKFESLCGAHNKKYHGPGPYGVRVYSIVSGVNSGKYIYAMGPTKWSALGARPGDDAHNEDWTGNVIPTILPDVNTVYWRFDTELSRFPKDFSVSKLMVWQVDVERNSFEKVMELLGQVNKVYAQKMPDDTYGIYINELGSTKLGDDLAIVWFFDKWSWMSDDSQFDKKFEEVHGAGSWAKFMTDWTAATVGIEREIWEYREDLSGLGPQVIAAERQ
jgi:hypothetical protein